MRPATSLAALVSVTGAKNPCVTTCTGWSAKTTVKTSTAGRISNRAAETGVGFNENIN